VLLPSHPGVAALAVPEGEHVGVNLFGGGHACPPVERVSTLQLCRAGCKRRRTDVISPGIPRITRRSDAEPDVRSGSWSSKNETLRAIT
jgi:hypothetical protein